MTWPSRRGAISWPTSVANCQTAHFANSAKVTKKSMCLPSNPSPLLTTRCVGYMSRYRKLVIATIQQPMQKSSCVDIFMCFIQHIIVSSGACCHWEAAEVRTGWIWRVQNTEPHPEQTVQDDLGDRWEPACVCTHGKLTLFKTQSFWQWSEFSPLICRLLVHTGSW